MSVTKRHCSARGRQWRSSAPALTTIIRNGTTIWLLQLLRREGFCFLNYGLTFNLEPKTFRAETGSSVDCLSEL
ncbi:hypothetical protein GCM10027295_10760 [Pseudaeromonas pectinilytica]